ncbi:hypothetical protein ACFLWG_03980, partial [Chloroflexota bacterium]
LIGHRKLKEAESLLLDQTISDDALVFSTLGKPLRPNTLIRAWPRLSAKAGVKVIQLHDAQHTQASLMLKHGIHPHVAPRLQEAAAQWFEEFVHKIKYK